MPDPFITGDEYDDADGCLCCGKQCSTFLFIKAALRGWKKDQDALAKAHARLRILEGDSMENRPANARALLAMAKLSVFRSWEDEKANEPKFFAVPLAEWKEVSSNGQWAISYFKHIGIAQPFEHFASEIERYEKAHGPKWRTQFEAALEGADG